MAQNKKNIEKEELSKFISSPEGLEWIKQNNLVKIIKEEEKPDFIFRSSDNKRIGIEHTRFIIKSKHGQALRSLMTIGNKIRKYILDKYGINTSIIIDKFDRKKLCFRTFKEYQEHLYNPGFIDLFDEKEIKKQLEPWLEREIPKIRSIHLIKTSIEIAGEYLTFTISDFPHLNNKYECCVNNECYSFPAPIDKIQEEIDKKNKKYDSYLKNCDTCYLLIYSPNISKGNYTYFTDEIIEHIFKSKFSDVFLYNANDKKCIKLKTKQI